MASSQNSFLTSFYIQVKSQGLDKKLEHLLYVHTEWAKHNFPAIREDGSCKDPQA